jgi:dihydrofolate synthase / folylpolyglutamate synthase
MMYREALDWLYGLQVHGVKLGLENIRRLCEALGIETASSERCRLIHVAGTNGKGSVCAMLAAICVATGRRSGLYTSPHLVSFRERIRLGPNRIPEDHVAEGLDRIKELIVSWDHVPTFFEVTTALALSWFQTQRAEIVILETGMGGRLDATNVVIPCVSVLTPIGFDHMQYLGATLAEIAGEKAGIIKPGVPCVSAPQLPDAERVVREKATALGAPLTFIKNPIGADWPLALAGPHQRWNAALAFAALIEAGIRPEPRIVREAFEVVEWPGRFQRIGEHIVIDGAHNPPAAEQLVETWRGEFGDEKVVLILGMLSDKDVAGVVAALAPIAARVVCVPVRSPRALPADDLARVVRETAPGLPVTAAETFGAALDSAQAAGERILIAGSLFLVGQALVHLGLAEGAQEWSAQ